MSRQLEIRVYEVAGSRLCIASDDGQKVHDRIAEALRNDRDVTVSFRNIDSLTSAFLNSAIGQLYSEFTEDAIKAHLAVTDMEPDDLALLKRVVDTAKDYFRDPKRYEDARREALGSEGDE